MPLLPLLGGEQQESCWQVVVNQSEALGDSSAEAAQEKQGLAITSTSLATTGNACFYSACRVHAA